MKDQILAIQEMKNLDEIKTATVEILLRLANRIETLEDTISATRETVSVIASGGKIPSQSTSHAIIG